MFETTCMQQVAQARPHTTSSDFLTLPGQQSIRVRKPQALPMLRGKKPPMVLCKKPPCNESSKVESKNATADCNDWRNIFACNGLLATGATGKVFSGTLAKPSVCTCGSKPFLQSLQSSTLDASRSLETHLGGRVR